MNQAKDPIQSRNDVAEFYVNMDAKELDKNLKLQACPSDLQGKVK